MKKIFLVLFCFSIFMQLQTAEKTAEKYFIFNFKDLENLDPKVLNNALENSFYFRVAMNNSKPNLPYGKVATGMFVCGFTFSAIAAAGGTLFMTIGLVAKDEKIINNSAGLMNNSFGVSIFVIPLAYYIIMKHLHKNALTKYLKNLSK